MYYQYFGLEEAPFSIAVNPRFLYMSPRHRDALAHLLYGVGAGGGFILLTGEVGTGKTTINRCLIEQLPDNADIAIVLNPALDVGDLLAAVCEELGIAFTEPAPGLKALTDALHRFLIENHSRERKTVLMIDEAQHLGIEVLEQIRLLTNLETDEEKLLHIILIGQPELAQKLSRPELRQLNQRITARFNLEPLTVDETGAYIRHRLHIAGMPAGGELFSPSLVRAIHRQSRGVPRLINLLCDRMLLGAYGAGASRMEKSLLRRAAREVTGESVDEWWGARWLLPALAGAALLATALSVWLLRTPAPQQPMPVPAGSAVAARSDRDPPAVPAVLQSSPSVSAEIPAARQYSAAPEAWRRSVREGAVLLAALYGREVGDTPCEIRDPLLRCELAEARSWDQILEEGRPVLLELVDQRRFQGSALFLGIENEQALLATDEGIASASLDLLAGDWTGRFWRYWQPPQSYRRTLQRGSSGEDVRAVSLLFARLDRQSEPLSDALYDARLEERVRLFQTVQGLDADGVLGEQTLKALVLAAGSDLSFTTAAGVIVERSSRGDWP